MKKLLFLALAIALVAIMVIGSSVMAAGPSKPSGNSGTAQLSLYQKNPTTWATIAKGASGKLTYNLSGPTFVYDFRATKLTMPLTGYSLIYYADPWPGNNPGALIASGTSDSFGGLSLVGSTELNMSMPSLPDTNLQAKIWLVLTSDYDALNSKMIGWNPTKYLFEDDNRIGAVYTDTNAGRVKLENKGYDGSNWSVISDGTYGYFNYGLSSTTISGVFNGLGLVAGTQYTLIKFNDVWNGAAQTVLGTGTVDALGLIRIAVAPVDIGAPQLWGADYAGQPAGYKVWLVPTAGMYTASFPWPPPFPNWLMETSLAR